MSHLVASAPPHDSVFALPQSLPSYGACDASVPSCGRRAKRRSGRAQLAQNRAEAPGFVAASLLDDSVIALLPETLPAPPPASAREDDVGGSAERPGGEEELPAKGPARRVWPSIRLQVGPSLAWRRAWC